MNPEIKTKWLEALASGKYKQGRERLKRYDKFCCLGVLTDIYIKEKGREWEFDSKPNGVYLFEGDGGLCPSIVCEWADFDNRGKVASDPIFPFDDREDDIVSLARLNDAGFTFSQLSDLIKAFL